MAERHHPPGPRTIAKRSEGVGRTLIEHGLAFQGGRGSGDRRHPDPDQHDRHTQHDQRGEPAPPCLRADPVSQIDRQIDLDPLLQPCGKLRFPSPACAVMTGTKPCTTPEAMSKLGWAPRFSLAGSRGKAGSSSKAC